MNPELQFRCEEGDMAGVKVSDDRIPPLDPLAATILNSLSAHIAIIDENGTILQTNLAWRIFAEKNRMTRPPDSIGVNYIGVCETAGGADHPDGVRVAEGLRHVISGGIDEFLHDYPCPSPDGPHWYYMRAVRVKGGGPLRVVVSHEDITALKLTEEALRKSREQLSDQAQSLEEANIALKVLLKQREADREELEKKMLRNVKELVFPYLEKLKSAPLKPREKTLVEIVETHLKDLLTPLLQHFSNARIVLTPQEIQVAALVRDGKGSKEISNLLGISEMTVHFHRKNLRDKLGLKNKRTNLRSYLISTSNW
jgi:DNA-binding CsgD family transcriptional regulator